MAGEPGCWECHLVTWRKGRTRLWSECVPRRKRARLRCMGKFGRRPSLYHRAAKRRAHHAGALAWLPFLLGAFRSTASEGDINQAPSPFVVAFDGENATGDSRLHCGISISQCRQWVNRVVAGSCRSLADFRNAPKADAESEHWHLSRRAKADVTSVR